MLALDEVDLLLHLAATVLDEGGCAVTRGTAGAAVRLPTALARPGTIARDVLLDGEGGGHARAIAPIPGLAGYALRII